MNRKLPRPIRNALAQPARGGVHPSPDVLTSFMERTLSREERGRVTDHLAVCGDCREAVFLTSNAADVIEDKKEPRAAAQGESFGSVKPQRRWRFGLAWASVAIAMLSVGGRFMWQRSAPVGTARPDVSIVASNNQSSPTTAPAASASSPTLSEAETKEKTATAKSAPPKTVPSRGPADIASSGGKGGQQHQPETSLAAAPTTAGALALPSVVGSTELTPPAPDPHKAFVESQADALSRLDKAAAIAKPSMSIRGLQSAPAQWRISTDGHLERRAGADGWTRMLNDEATTFHVVSVMGDNVWAGGERGALFHSDDRGQHWKRVPLIASSSTETGTIASIQFEDSQQGTVLTAGGARWSTSDGGVSGPCGSPTSSSDQRQRSHNPSVCAKSRSTRSNFCSSDYHFSFGPKPFTTPVSRAKSFGERLSAVVGDLALLFAYSVDRTASFVCCREVIMEFLETWRTMGLTSNRSPSGMSRLRAIASTST